MSTQRACVIGYPIGHSLSPVLHGFWLKKYGIDGEYTARELRPENLKEGLIDIKEQGFAGCNLTLPHKELALPLMDTLSDAAKSIAAVNTIIIKDNSFHGTNTDAYGFMENLKAQVQDLTPYLAHCLILGAGGAAKAVHYALKKAGAKRISLTNRSPERARAFVADLIDWQNKDEALHDVTLLVNTTSLGMKAQPPLTLSLNALPKDALVTDIVYQPLQTPLLAEAKARGNVIVSGIGMLIYQAVPGFEAWFGYKPEVNNEVFELLEGRLG